MAGRKTMRDEVAILRRYNDLTEPYFRVLRDHLESERKEDRRWAADNLKSAFAKMIPQDLNLGGQAIKITFDTSFNDNPPSETEGDSTEQETV
jgi:hypothetical protein